MSRIPGVLLPGCSICRYDAGDDTFIEAVGQRNGPDRWAVRRRGEVLGRTGEWEWEPQNSNRDEAFLARCRFDSPDEALEALQHARRNA